MVDSSFRDPLSKYCKLLQNEKNLLSSFMERKQVHLSVEDMLYGTSIGVCIGVFYSISFRKSIMNNYTIFDTFF